jgi:hypothetical protein
MERKGIFAKMFDLSFAEFVTIDLVKILYVLGIIAAALVALGVVVSGFARGSGSGLFALLFLAPLTFAFFTVAARVYAEMILVFFRIAESTQRTADHLSAGPDKPVS